MPRRCTHTPCRASAWRPSGRRGGCGSNGRRATSSTRGRWAPRCGCDPGGRRSGRVRDGARRAPAPDPDARNARARGGERRRARIGIRTRVHRGLLGCGRRRSALHARGERGILADDRASAAAPAASPPATRSSTSSPACVPFDAEHALRVGAIDRVVTAEELEQTALDHAALATRAGAALAAGRRSF